MKIPFTAAPHDVERARFEPYSAFDIPADLRQLHGRYDVEAMARRLRNFRYAEEWTLMLLGGWIATIPELPVKTGLGRIIWEGAQAADELGKRLPELRCGRRAVEASVAPNPGLAALIQALAEPEAPELTIEKLAGVFDVLKPHLIDAYERTAARTDAICDAPTVKILGEIVQRARTHVAWGRDVLARLCASDAQRARRSARSAAIQSALAACGGVSGEL